MALKRRQQAAQLLRDFIGDKAAEPIIQVGRDFVEGAKTGADVMTARGDRRHSVFSKDYYKDITEGGVGIGQKARANPYNVAGGRNVDYVTQPITFKENPAGFLGAYGSRLFTDVGTDSSRQFYWRYNHPMAIAEKVIEQAVPALGDIKNPVTRSAITLGVSAPVASSLGVFDITNPGEMFRPKGYAQKYSEKGAEDRRETAQPGMELVDRVVLGRQGQPLKYETAKQEIPDLTKERYGKVMRNYYQDKGLFGLGLVKATDENIQGVPEARIVGFPVGLQAAGALAGGAATARKTVGNMSNRRAAAITSAGAIAGGLTGNLINRAIASSRNNPERLPDTLEYLG